MRYTIKLQGTKTAAEVWAAEGQVVFNGQRLLPFEADMLSQALRECADKAEDMAGERAAGFLL